jgi:hypothetical protein
MLKTDMTMRGIMSKNSKMRPAKKFLIFIFLIMLTCLSLAFIKSAFYPQELRAEQVAKDSAEIVQARGIFTQWLGDIPKNNSIWWLSLIFVIPVLAFIGWIIYSIYDAVINFVSDQTEDRV